MRTERRVYRSRKTGNAVGVSRTANILAWSGNWLRGILGTGCFVLVTFAWAGAAEIDASDLQLGKFSPAFDHLGNLGEQLDAAIASRCTLVYATGIGTYSYSGLPPKKTMDAYVAKLKAYTSRAHSNGVVILSYLCATSIVDPDHFATNWDDYFSGRATAFTPRRMLQQDINGANLPSWYGGAYTPADMWNPYWREYTKFTIKLAVQAGHDGVFFDNPTVHPSGNYSEYAMAAWGKFLKQEGEVPPNDNLATLRELTKSHPELWRRFRATEAADFFREMRAYGESLKPGFILTGNNSLNTWDSFYSQPQDYGYSIPEQSKHEDVVTIEDMSSQPRRDASGFVSYGSTLRLLHAITSQPLSVCTIDGNYTAPADFMCLATAECKAHDAAYMVWSCWDPAFRSGLAASVARYQDFIRTNEGMFVCAGPVSEILLVWPYQNWLHQRDCLTAMLARELSAANLQYSVTTDSRLKDYGPNSGLKSYRMIIYAAEEGLGPKVPLKMLEEYQRGGGIVRPVFAKPGGKISPLGLANAVPVSVASLPGMLDERIVAITNQPGVRAALRVMPGRGFVLHLYNLNVTRKDTYQDEVIPAENVNVELYLPDLQADVECIRILTPDENGSRGEVKFSRLPTKKGVKLEFVVPKIWIWTVAKVEIKVK